LVLLLGKNKFATSPYRMGEPLLLDGGRSFIDIAAESTSTRIRLGVSDSARWRRLLGNIGEVDRRAHEAQLRGRPVFEKALILPESTGAFDYPELSLLNDLAQQLRPLAGQGTSTPAPDKSLVQFEIPKSALTVQSHRPNLVRRLVL
jgi:hypothetical protein